MPAAGAPGLRARTAGAPRRWRCAGRSRRAPRRQLRGRVAAVRRPGPSCGVWSSGLASSALTGTVPSLRCGTRASGQPAGVAGPTFDVGPVPRGTAADRPARRGQQAPELPLGDGLGPRPEPFTDLQLADGLHPQQTRPPRRRPLTGHTDIVIEHYYQLVASTIYYAAGGTSRPETDDAWPLPSWRARSAAKRPARASTACRSCSALRGTRRGWSRRSGRSRSSSPGGERCRPVVTTSPLDRTTSEPTSAGTSRRTTDASTHPRPCRRG